MGTPSVSATWREHRLCLLNYFGTAANSQEHRLPSPKAAQGKTQVAGNTAPVDTSNPGKNREHRPYPQKNFGECSGTPPRSTKAITGIARMARTTLRKARVAESTAPVNTKWLGGAQTSRKRSLLPTQVTTGRPGNTDTVDRNSLGCNSSGQEHRPCRHK